MYLFGSIFILLIILLILIFAVGLPILAGVLVYHDANKRTDCSPWLWTLAAVFVPCFIGVVVYLIIRKDYPLKESCRPYGSQQTYQYDGGYDRSESGGAQAEYGPEGEFSRQYGEPEKKAFPTWAKALIIIVAVIVVICLIALAVSAIKMMTGYSPIYDSYHYGF